MKIARVSVKNYVATSKIPGAGYVINPYVGCPHRCLYCYAQFMCKFSGHTEPWGQFLDVKQCSVPLKPSQLFGQHVLLSSVTDAYNPFEQTYQVTRNILQQLVKCRTYVSVLTKSALVTRDIDLFKQLPGCEIGFSFSTTDEKLRLQLEPGAAGIAERLEALKTVHEAGLPTAVMAAPLLPGISDFKAIVDACAPYTKIFRFDSLNMRSTFRKQVLDFVDIHYPHLLPLYDALYHCEEQDYWQQLNTEICTYCKKLGLEAEVFFGKGNSPQPNLSVKPVSAELSFPTDEPQLF